MEQLWAIWSCLRPRPKRRRRTSLILRMDTLSWGTKFPPLVMENFSTPCCPAPPAADEDFFRKSFRHVNNDSDLGSLFYSFCPGIVIHIAPESLFTSARNDYSHAPEYAAQS